MRRVSLVLLVGVLVLGCLAAGAPAQQVTVTTPFRQLGDSFFEKNGINWSGHYGGINYSFGSAGLANPQFGGYDPAAALKTNFAILGKHGGTNFALEFGQGYRQSLVTQAPSVTLMNGQTGFFSDTSQTPFVISQVPVVGAFPMMGTFGPNPYLFSLNDPARMSQLSPRVQAMLQARADAAASASAVDETFQQPQQPVIQHPAPRAGGVRRPAPNGVGAGGVGAKPPDLAPDVGRPAPNDGPGGKLAAAQLSSAGRAAPSVAEAKRMHDQEKGGGDAEVLALFERAKAAEEDSKPNVAKIYYQMVAKRASGQLKQQAQERLDALRGPTAP